MRWRMLLKRAAITMTTIVIAIGVLIGIALVIFAVMNYMASRRLQAKLAEIEGAGESVSLVSFAAVPVPPEQDAAVQLERLRGDIEAAERDFAPLRDQQKAAEFYQDERLTLAGAAFVRTTFARYPELISKLRAATALQSYASPQDFTKKPQAFLDSLLDRTAFIRGAARHLDRHGNLMLMEGDSKEAFRDGIAILRLASHFDHEPTQISYLVSLALRGVGLGLLNRILNDEPIDDESRKELEQVLTDQDSLSAFEHSLRTERASALAHSHEVMPYAITRTSFPYVNDQADMLEMMTEQIRLGAKPRYQIKGDLDQLKSRAASFGMMSKMLYPAIERARDTNDRIRAMMRCLRVVNAMQRHAAKTGKPPESINGLELPKDAKIDPFDGEPMRIKQTDEGWIVYSVGANGIDDGGKIEKHEDVGFGPVKVFVTK